MPKPPGDPVADHRIPDGLAHHKTRPGRIGCGHGRVRGQRVDDETPPTGPRPPAEDDPEVLTPPQTCGNGQHGVPRRAGSSGQRAAALATAGRQDGPARTGPHAEAETVDPGASSVVRLEGALTLAHCFSCVSAVGRRLFGRLYRHVVRSHGSLWCLLPTCGLVTTSDDIPGHAKRARRLRETLRGYAPRSGAVKAPLYHAPRPDPDPRPTDRPGIEWPRAGPREMLARDDVLWPRTGLVSVPLSGHRTRWRRDRGPGVEALGADVEPARGVATGRRTLVHSCGQLCGYSLCPCAGRSKMTSEGEFRACLG